MTSVSNHSQPEVKNAFRALHPDHIYLIGLYAADESLSERDIYAKARIPKNKEKYARKFLTTYRKINAELSRSEQKQEERIDKEIADAYHAPGHGDYDHKRKANGHRDNDQIVRHRVSDFEEARRAAHAGHVAHAGHPHAAGG